MAEIEPNNIQTRNQLIYLPGAFSIQEGKLLTKNGRQFKKIIFLKSGCNSSISTSVQSRFR